MPETIILICFCFNSIKIAAQINAFAMPLGLSQVACSADYYNPFYVPWDYQILYSVDQVFSSISLNPTIYDLFPEVIVPYISVFLESVSN